MTIGISGFCRNRCKDSTLFELIFGNVLYLGGFIFCSLIVLIPMIGSQIDYRWWGYGAAMVWSYSAAVVVPRIADRRYPTENGVANIANWRALVAMYVVGSGVLYVVVSRFVE